MYIWSMKVLAKPKQASYERAISLTSEISCRVKWVHKFIISGIRFKLITNINCKAIQTCLNTACTGKIQMKENLNVSRSRYNNFRPSHVQRIHRAGSEQNLGCDRDTTNMEKINKKGNVYTKLHRRIWGCSTTTRKKCVLSLEDRDHVPGP